MNFLVVVVTGGGLGWLASLIMRTEPQQGAALNVVVGIAGAILAGVFVIPLIGGAPITQGAFDIASLVASLIGAIILLAIVNLIRRGTTG